jgi:hypothetical protein
MAHGFQHHNKEHGENRDRRNQCNSLQEMQKGAEPFETKKYLKKHEMHGTFDSQQSNKT